ncbi:MAG: nucleotide pyrophosphohydrolase [Candidatus Micrarchaeota archaeon]|nr:nucleotide pyrophosphohydrolase [Candidatus Micrarchaeota archaeon]
MNHEDLQKKVKEFCRQHNLDAPAEHRVLDALSELGEVAKEILKMTDYGKRKPEYRKEIENELGDLLFSIIALANSFDVDLGQALDMALKKYEQRLKKGSAGSEND